MTFTLTSTQRAQVLTWTCDHTRVKDPDKGTPCTCHIHGGAIGGSVTYQFTPTSIGTIEGVLCSCGAELDLTDYDSF